MAIYVREPSGEIRGVPDSFETTIMARVNSTLDGVRLATAAEITEAGFEVPEGQPA